MKSKKNPQPKSGGVRLLEIAFLALPILALIPNFFVVPDLAFPGLVTQELVFMLSAAGFSALGLFELVRAGSGPFQLSRPRAMLFTSLLVFILWQVITLAWS